jgi:protein-disulfide isomerase
MDAAAPRRVTAFRQSDWSASRLTLMKQNKKPIFFGIWIGILVILTAVMNYMQKLTDTPPAPPPVDPRVIQNRWDGVMAHAVGGPKGNPKAPYTVVEFGDFCCPQCGRMHDLFASLPEHAPVNLYFVNRPFPRLKDHENAGVAAQAGYAAAAQGKFWPMFDALYAHQKDLQNKGFNTNSFAQYANSAGLNGTVVASDVKSGKYADKVKDSMAFCQSIAETSTPSILLRDNKTGRVKTAEGHDEIVKLFDSAPWAHAQAAPVAAAPAGGPNVGPAAPAVAKGQ